MGDDVELLWSEAESLVRVSPFTTAIRWPRRSRREVVYAGGIPPNVPQGIMDDWLDRTIHPMVRGFLVDTGAVEVMTVLDWRDGGIKIASDLIKTWQHLVRRVWQDARTALLLVSGCGFADTSESVTFLVHPYGETRAFKRARRRARRAPRWSERDPRLVFRGSATGARGFDERTVFETVPRVRLLGALRESGLPADARITDIGEPAEGREEAVEEALRGHALLASGRLTIPEMMHYRYQLMVDGNHGAWGAHVWKLLSGSTCLWVKTTSRNWYDEFFEPWVHYVPVREDGEDLIEQYSRVLDDEALGRRIADACRRRARHLFRRRFMLQIQRKQWHDKWRRLLNAHELLA